MQVPTPAQGTRRVGHYRRVRRIDLSALGARIVVGLGADVDQRTEDALRHLWRDALLPSAPAGRPPDAPSPDAPSPETPDAPLPAIWVGTAPPGLPEHIPRIPADDERRLASDLSSLVTLAAIAERAGDGLLVHACAAADAEGRVVVFVGESGAGKSTLVAALGRQYGYVTDEAVLIDGNGRVPPFRKPLSLVTANRCLADKRQVASADLGMRVGSDDLSVAAVVLLDRRPDADRPFRLEPLDAVDAAQGLIPHLNRAGDDPRTLHRIARLLETTGGVSRLSYAEAAEAVHPDAGLFTRAATLAEAGGGIRIAHLSGPAASARPTSGRRPGGPEVARDPRAVSLSVGERTVVHSASGLHELSPVSAALWMALADGALPLHALAARIERHFGPPAGGSTSDALLPLLHHLRQEQILG